MQKEPQPAPDTPDILDEIEKIYGVDRSFLRKVSDALSGRTHAVRLEDAKREYPEAMSSQEKHANDDGPSI
jgi:hypothetical protein